MLLDYFLFCKCRVRIKIQHLILRKSFFHNSCLEKCYLVHKKHSKSFFNDQRLPCYDALDFINLPPFPDNKKRKIHFYHKIYKNNVKNANLL